MIVQVRPAEPKPQLPCGANSMTDMLIKDPSQLGAVMSLTTPPSRSFGGSFYPTGWLYQSKVRSNHYFDEMFARIEPGKRRYLGERPAPSSPEFIKGPAEKIRFIFFAIQRFYKCIRNFKSDIMPCKAIFIANVSKADN